ncbi:MAG: hypothetical protein QJR05_08785 [Thermoanaerobacterium sp.]|nr:hypothetical protein [Thermoanaerobacterium sp.]
MLVNTYDKRTTFDESINTNLELNETSAQLAYQYSKMIFSRTITLFHESFIHAESFAQDFMDNGKIDYSNISSQNKIGPQSQWQHNQVYCNGINDSWPGDVYKALMDINGNMNLQYSDKQILQNLWFYVGSKDVK